MNTIPLPSDCCSECPDTATTQIPGPTGATGAAGANGSNGTNAYTTTTAGFTMPGVGINVTVPVVNSDWATIGQVIYVQDAGYFSVQSKPASTSIQIQNLGYTGNAAGGAAIANTKQISPGGIKGTDGAAGSTTLNALSPTTTKGDIIADNGANSPSASDVRLAVGSNGKALVADSTQATGLNYATITPNSATNDKNIPRFSGTTGTPMALQDSKMLITDDGALQSTPTGGNARGSKAVDLQVNRAGATQVSSGSKCTIGGGDGNTASGNTATVAGGASNVASGDFSAVGGGTTNTASSADATVSGGTTNTAIAPNATVAGGSANAATATNSAIGGGGSNTASGNYSSIPGGNSNTANATNSVASGASALASHYGERAHASGAFSTAGDAQTSIAVLRISTPDGTPAEAFLDGSGQRLTIPSDTTWAFRMLIVARRTDADNESAAYQLLGCIDRNGPAATTALVGAVGKTVIAEDTAAWDVAATADAVNGALILTVTGEAAKTIRWVATVELTQITG